MTLSIKHPKLFISYSQTDDRHKDWVANLAESLLKDGSRKQSVQRRKCLDRNRDSIPTLYITNNGTTNNNYYKHGKSL